MFSKLRLTSYVWQLNIDVGYYIFGPMEEIASWKLETPSKDSSSAYQLQKNLTSG